MNTDEPNVITSSFRQRCIDSRDHATNELSTSNSSIKLEFYVHHGASQIAEHTPSRDNHIFFALLFLWRGRHYGLIRRGSGIFQATRRRFGQAKDTDRQGMLHV